jgi:hypothetical protein
MNDKVEDIVYKDPELFEKYLELSTKIAIKYPNLWLESNLP